MIETKEKYIDGANYTVTQLPARRALRLKTKLLKLFGPVLAQVFITATEQGTDDQKKRDLVTAVEILSSSINENEYESLIIELLNGVRKNGVELTPPTIDLEFAGDMESLYHLLWFVVEVNFANFFSMLGIGSLFSQEANTQKVDTKKTYSRS